MKKYVVALLLILSFFLFAPTADARVACTKKSLTDAKNKAYMTEVSYVFHKTDKGERYFEIVLTNLPEGIEARIDGNFIAEGGKDEKVIIERFFPDGATIEIDLQIIEGKACAGERVYTKRVTLPKYNIYSERDECIEYEEFALCNPWYKKEIDGDYEFNTKLAEYIEKINGQKEEKQKAREKNIIEKMMDIYMNNLSISIPITVVIVVGTVAIIIRKTIRKRKRIKIDISKGD